MNAAERQALRDRHVDQYGLCVYCFVPDPDMRGHTLFADYPCDVIRVLDALEAQNEIIQELCTCIEEMTE
jgi:hypothetical protein